MRRLPVVLVVFLSLVAGGTGALRFAHKAIAHGPAFAACQSCCPGADKQSPCKSPSPINADDSDCPTCLLLAIGSAPVRPAAVLPYDRLVAVLPAPSALDPHIILCLDGRQARAPPGAA